MTDNKEIELQGEDNQVVEQSTEEKVESESNEVVEQKANEEVKKEDGKDISKFKANPNKDEARIKAREGIINSFVQKVALGEKELDEVPEWVKKDVEEHLEKVIKPKDTQPAIEDLKKTVKEEMKFEFELERLQEELTQSQIDKLHSEFEKLSGYGLPKTEALRLAKIQLGDTTINKPKADLPPVGRQQINTSFKTLTVAEYDSLPIKARKEYMQKSIEEKGDLILK